MCEEKKDLAWDKQEMYNEMYYVISMIAHDGHELSWEKIREQRDFFIKEAQRVLYQKKRRVT